MKSIPSVTRFEFDRSRYVDGQLLVSGPGMSGEAFEDLLFVQSHGFASRPPKGATGVVMVMPGRRTQSVILGVEAQANRPDLPEGASALYDQYGNIIKLFADGVSMDFGSRTITMIGGTWNIKGDLNVEGNIHATGTIIDESGNTPNHSH